MHILLLKSCAIHFIMLNSCCTYCSQVFDIIMKDSQYQDRIIENTEMFREGMTKHRFRVAGDNHPICPIMIGDAKIAAQFADNLLSTYTQGTSVTWWIIESQQL